MTNNIKRCSCCALPLGLIYIHDNCCSPKRDKENCPCKCFKILREKFIKNLRREQKEAMNKKDPIFGEVVDMRPADFIAEINKRMDSNLTLADMLTITKDMFRALGALNTFLFKNKPKVEIGDIREGLIKTQRSVAVLYWAGDLEIMQGFNFFPPEVKNALYDFINMDFEVYDYKTLETVLKPCLDTMMNFLPERK